MRPNLSDPAARAAYQNELRRLARWWRLVGFMLIVGGVASQFYVRWQGIAGAWPMRAGWALIALGWAIFLGVIVYRTRYHKARMAEPNSRA
jgi:hypothetical protein